MRAFLRMLLLYQVCKTIENDDTEMVMMVTTIAIPMVDDKEQDHKNDDIHAANAMISIFCHFL